MQTSHELAETLKQFRVEDVAQRSGVSVKTIYRLRHQQHSPTLDTVEKLLKAIDEIRKAAAKAAA
jgi:transcriptional regulator with XRE-family HTH domain